MVGIVTAVDSSWPSKELPPDRRVVDHHREFLPDVARYVPDLGDSAGRGAPRVFEKVVNRARGCAAVEASAGGKGA